MRKQTFFLLLCASSSLICSGWRSFGQELSLSSLSVTGTGAINTLVSNAASIASGSMGDLVVGGTADILGNTLYLGAWSNNLSQPGWTLLYNDGTSGANSNITQVLTRSSAAWRWQRIAESGSAANVMVIDAANRLILTGTDPNNSSQLVLDPNGQGGSAGVLTQRMADIRYIMNGGTNETILANTTINGTETINGSLNISGSVTANGSNLVTRAQTDALYLSATAGVSIVNGEVGIGVTSPGAKLQINTTSSRIGQIIRAADSQTADLQQWQNAAGNKLAGISYDGSALVSTLCSMVNYGGGGKFTTFANAYVGGFLISGSAVGSLPVVAFVRTTDNAYDFGVYGYDLRFVTSGSWSGTWVETFRITRSGNVGIGTATPNAKLDVNGSARIAGNLALSNTGALALPDGTILSASNTIKNIVTSGTALTISGTISPNQVPGLLSAIPNDTQQLTNGAGYITSAGTAAFAQLSGTASALSGTLDYSKITNRPTQLSAFTNDCGYLTSGTTANDMALSGTTKITGAVVVMGTLDRNTNTIVASGSNQVLLIPQQGDLSMGQFTAGAQPQ